VEDVLATTYGEHSPGEDSTEEWTSALERADAAAEREDETERADA
jgi:hypothetical protein